MMNNDATGFSRSAIANGYGEYRIDYLPIGTYTIQVQAQGFKTFVQHDLTLTVDQVRVVEDPR